MTRYTHLEHEFVHHIPERLQPGVLYISMDFATAAHSCCCGCGEEVVTPFTPTDWKMTFDGETISLWPSIGSWSNPCRSHYIVEQSRIKEALPWTAQEITDERRRDQTVKKRFYAATAQAKTEDVPTLATPLFKETSSLWSRIKGWLLLK